MTVSSGTIADLREAAREYDVDAPQIAEEYGGMGEDFRDVLPVFEEAAAACSAPPRCASTPPTRGTYTCRS